MNFKIVIDR